MFKKLIRRLVIWAQTDEICSEARYESNTKNDQTISVAPISERNPGLKFTIYNASGGKVIQIYSYDHRTDKSSSNLYIITDKEDLGEELALIITRETISR